MPNEMQKKNLAKLDLEYGSGIFTNNSRVDSVDQATVIISLGGLGGSTLNALKAQILKRVNKDKNSIKLLAIDSDKDSLSSFDNLDEEEKLSLYEPSIPLITANPEMIPAHIKEWKNPKFEAHLTGAGCGGVRQNGRFILSVPAVYNKVRAKLAAVIKDARAIAVNPKVNIIFIAGISGGTGSGTFIDMAYLTQDILKVECAIAARNQYKMSAYIYTPDVQYGVGGVMIPALQRNAYAALKELDYYYNIDKFNGIYKWPFSEGSLKDSREKIYDFCSLISASDESGTVLGDPKDVAIDVTVESLMAIITNAKLEDKSGKPVQILSSFLDNEKNTVDVWLTAGGGKEAAQFPRSSNYCYNVIGYGSAKIPVDAIMSYMAFEMYSKLLDEFYDTKGLTSEYIANMMNVSNVGDVGSVVRAVRELAQYTYNPRELPSGGDCKGLKGSYVQWKQAAYQHYTSMKTQPQYTKAIDKAVENIIKALDSRLEQAFNEHGPYYVVRSITSTKADSGVSGVDEKLRDLIQAIIDEHDARVNKFRSWQQVEQRIDSMAKDLSGLFGPSKEDRDQFILNARRIIEQLTIELDIMEKMVEQLGVVRNNIIKKNNSVFNVYTEVLEHIKKMLSKNSDLVVNSSMTEHEGGVTYSLDVANLDAATENGRRLKQCVDSFLTTEFIEKFKASFETALRDPDNRPAFTDSVDRFNASGVIQKIFDDLLGEYYQEAVERFLIAYYSDDPDMTNNTKLEAVMGSEEEKAVALKKAADIICQKLGNSSKPLCQIVGAAGISVFAPPHKYMVIPKVIRNAFQTSAKNVFGDTIEICEREHAFSIDVVTNYIGIPLSMIHGMNDCDLAYDTAIGNNTPGLHLDENVEDFTKLPAPYSYEVWKKIGNGNHSCALEQKNIDRITALVNKLDKDGLNLLVADADGYNLRVKNYFETEITDEMISNIKKDAAYEVGANTDKEAYIASVIAKLGLATSELSVSMTGADTGLSATYDNRYIIVRKNVPLCRKLEKFVNEYAKIDEAIGDILNVNIGEKTFNSNVNYFIDFMRAGYVTYDKSKGGWLYNDTVNDKPLYVFMREEPFEKLYHLFFAFAKFTVELDPRIKNEINKSVKEKFDNMQTNNIIPEDLDAEIKNLFTTGPNPVMAKYLIDKEFNRKEINDEFLSRAPKYKDMPLPMGDGMDILRKFYEKFMEIYSM